MTAKIHIENLRLRAIIGVFDWEREHKQDVVIQLRMGFDADKAVKSDALEDTLDYKAITKKIITFVEGSSFQLIESMAAGIIRIVMEDPRVEKVRVRVAKPQALRFADCVSVTLSEER